MGKGGVKSESFPACVCFTEPRPQGCVSPFPKTCKHPRFSYKMSLEERFAHAGNRLAKMQAGDGMRRGADCGECGGVQTDDRGLPRGLGTAASLNINAPYTPAYAPPYTP